MSKILLVEDDNNLREIFEMRLQAEGYDTLTASDGEEALVVALKEKPTLIIADVMMPKMSGFEMLETLRAAPDTNNIKVIMMTALGQAEDQARGQKLGVVKYLVKSQVTLEDFVRVVKEVLAPADDTAMPSQTAPEPVQGDTSTNNKGNEGNMPPADNSAPTNDNPAPAADANPVSDAPSTDGQQTTADEQAAVQTQVDSAMGGAPAPAADAPAEPAAAPDVPVETPPADPAPAGDAPATPPAEGGPAAAPPGGM